MAFVRAQNANLKKWKSALTVKGSRKFLGYFASESEAALAYDKASLKYRRGKGHLNFPAEGHLQEQESEPKEEEEQEDEYEYEEQEQDEKEEQEEEEVQDEKEEHEEEKADERPVKKSCNCAQGCPPTKRLNAEPSTPITEESFGDKETMNEPPRQAVMEEDTPRTTQDLMHFFKLPAFGCSGEDGCC